MKTISEIALESGVHRTTLNKAIDRKIFPARKSGKFWLIDDESEAFKTWLTSRKRQAISSTSEVEVPERMCN